MKNTEKTRKKSGGTASGQTVEKKGATKRSAKPDTAARSAQAEVKKLREQLALASKELGRCGKELKELSKFREEGERLRSLVEQSNDIIYIHDLDGWFIDANPSAQVILGYKKKEIPSVHLSAIFDEEELARAMVNTKILLARGKLLRPIEYRLRTRKGDILYVETMASILYRDGKPFAVQGIARDITERRMVEKALRESEEKFAKAFHNVQVPMGLVRLEDGFFLEVNRAFLRMYGYPLKDIIGSDASTVGFWVDPSKRLQFMKRIQHGEDVINEKVGLRTRDGDVLVALFSGVGIRVGGVPCFLGSAIDITEMERATNELRASEEKYRNIIEQSDEVFYMYGADGRFRYVSHQVVDIIGYDVNEIVEHWHEFITDSPINEIGFERVRAALDTGKAQPSYFMEIVKKDGSRAILEIHEAPFRDDGGMIAGIVGAAHDVTVKVRFESALLESEEKFRRLFKNSGGAQLLLEGDRILDCNDGALKMFGCREGVDLVGRSLREFSPEFQPDGELSDTKGVRYADLAQSLQGVSFEWLHRKVTGEQFYAEVILTSIPFKGRNILHGDMRDITDRKRLQNEIINVVDIAQQKLGQDLHDGVGQELTGLSFLCNRLTKRLESRGETEAERAREILDLVYTIIRRVRTLSRELYPPTLTENEIVFTLTEFAENIVSMFGIECLFEHDGELVVNDPFISMQLYYVVREAVNNAIRHGRARKIIIRLTSDIERAILAIEDNGRGLPEHPDTHRGLGLRIMAYRVESINGLFNITKNKSGGVTIMCSFPLYMAKGEFSH